MNSKSKAKKPLATINKKAKVISKADPEHSEYRKDYLEASSNTKKEFLEYYNTHLYWTKNELSPITSNGRIIDEIPIRWDYKNGKFDKGVYAVLYGTPGTKKVEGEDVDCVFQFFLYYDNRVWKPRSILHCMSIVESIVYCEGVLKTFYP